MTTTKIKIKTAVVILNWNGKKLLEQFIPSVISHTVSDDCSVVIADNGSTDDSVAFMKTEYPDVPLIVLDRNYGFAEGYNKVLEKVDSEYVVLLNSDVETTPGWVTGLISFMDTNLDVAAVQPKILSYSDRDKFEYAGAAGGFIDKYGYPFCRGRILNTVETDEGQYDKEIDIFWATGACMCVRLRDYQEAGGLDGRFFAHMEEIDLCWRFNARGRRVMCIPSSIVYHVGGASLSKDNPKKMYLNFRNNLLMLYKNVTQEKFNRTFFFRYIFDFMAFIHLLVKGQFKSAKAVIKAYIDYFEMRKSYKSIRAENMSKVTVPDISSQFNKSLLINYYTGKKTFNSLVK